MAGADRGCVLSGRVTGPSRALIYALPPALALFVIVLVTPASAWSTGRLAPAGHAFAVAQVSDADSGNLVATRVTGRHTQAQAWPGWGAGAEPALLPIAVPLASVLLALQRRTRPQGRSPRSFPPRRGPPPLAFTR